MQQCVYRTLPLPKLRNDRLTAHSLAMHFHDLLIAAALLLSAFIHRHTYTSSSFSSHCSSFQSPCSTASQEFARLYFTPSALFFTCTRRLISHRYSPPYVAFLLLSGDIELNHGPSNLCLCTLTIDSILHPLHSAALSDIIETHHPDLFCLTETWIKSTATPTELAHCTPPNYTFMSFPRISVNYRSSAATGGGTLFLIREPLTQLPSSLPNFSSFELSSLALKLLSYHSPKYPSSISTVPLFHLPFLNPFPAFLTNSSLFSIAATTPHEFIITGDFSLHLDNPSDHLHLPVSVCSILVQPNSAC